jgi:acyl-CoA synthetase (AMP-forming)/AMP-acid ligase II
VGALLPFLAAVRTGVTLIVMESFDAALAWKVCERENVTSFIAVPSMLNGMLPELESGRADASSVRWILTGAAPIPSSLLEAYAAHGVEIVSAYGLTEAFGQGCILAADHAAAHIGSVGKPFFCLDARVVDAAGRRCPPDEPGEVLLRGPCVMKRYWKRPEETSETLRDGWLHTGDVATVDADGFYTIRDRTKDMIISGGENIYPAEIENVLHGHPAIADVAVIGQPNARWGESPFVVAVRNDETLLERDLLAWLDGRIAGFKRPTGVAFVSELPRNPSGKLLKHALRKQFPGADPQEPSSVSVPVFRST